MLTVEEALSQCMALRLPRRVETIPLDTAAGRVLASDHCAAHPQPRWDNAAMDGYALRIADCASSSTPQPSCDLASAEALPAAVATLTVTETIQAGTVGQHMVGPGQAARIMTGAPLPEGADTVVIRENCTHSDDQVTIHGRPRQGQHIRRAGEEFQPGVLLVASGSTLTPSRIGLLASQGLHSVPVVARPRVGILSTGDEVQPAGHPLQHGQIWSSNTAALIGMVEAAGGEAVDFGIAPDTLQGTQAAFQRGLDAGCDLLLSTGGVSVGDFDLVKDAMGAEMRFWKVRIKPGKPLALGSIGGIPAFGLPGNPVSCLINFLQFVRPVIRRALSDPRPYLPVLRAKLTSSYHKRHRRAEFVRVRIRIRDGHLEATPTGNQSSSWISSMADADALMLIGADATGFDAGEPVWVQILQGGGIFSSAEPDYPW